MCILNFGLCSVFVFLAYEGMSGTTNLAVVDLSPYGFVFKELALQTSILNVFLSFFFMFFCIFVTNNFAHCRNHFAQLVFKGCTPPLNTGDDIVPPYKGIYKGGVHPLI